MIMLPSGKVLTALCWGLSLSHQGPLCLEWVTQLPVLTEAANSPAVIHAHYAQLILLSDTYQHCRVLCLHALFFLAIATLICRFHCT